MIIYKNGNYMKDSRYPNIKFDTEALYFIDDNSELANKYIDIFSSSGQPKIIASENNEVIDVLEDKEYKIKIQNQYQINILKSQLANEDYKIIKCYEASLMGWDMPYDYQTLILQRQKIRQQIEELEG